MVETNTHFKVLFPDINYVRMVMDFIYLHKTNNSKSSAYLIIYDNKERKEFFNQITK